MTRYSSAIAALLATLCLTAFSGSAAACEGHAPAAAPQKTEAQKAESAKAEAQQAPVLQDVDVLLADKCDCGGQADCTCKKGQCKCGKCGGAKLKKLRLFDSLKGESDALTLPNDARHDATAGAFI